MVRLGVQRVTGLGRPGLALWLLLEAALPAAHPASLVFDSPCGRHGSAEWTNRKESLLSGHYTTHACADFPRDGACPRPLLSAVAAPAGIGLFDFQPVVLVGYGPVGPEPATLSPADTDPGAEEALEGDGPPAVHGQFGPACGVNVSWSRATAVAEGTCVGLTRLCRTRGC